MRSPARPADSLVLVGALLLAALTACGEPETAPSDSPSSDILDRITRPGDGGEVHLVRLVQHGDAYAFEPAELTIASGDVVRFVMAGTQPESVAFRADGAAPEAAAFIRETGLERGILLTEPGAAYDVNFPDAPAGTYPFESIPHGALGMRGTVRVTSP